MKDIFEKIQKNMGPLGIHSKEAHGYYTFPKLEGELAPRMKFMGKEVLNWSLNNYLGLGNNPEVRKADAEAAAKIKGNTASEPAGGSFAPHDQVGSILDENNSPFEKIVDNNTVIGPPGILGPSSLIPPDSRPVNIIITSNVGPYGLVTNPRKPQEISYNHELGDKTNTQVNKTMSFMEHVMNTSR